LLTTFYDFFIRHFKKTQVIFFLKSEKNVNTYSRTLSERLLTNLKKKISCCQVAADRTTSSGIALLHADNGCSKRVNFYGMHHAWFEFNRQLSSMCVVQEVGFVGTLYFCNHLYCMLQPIGCKIGKLLYICACMCVISFTHLFVALP